MQPDAIVSMQQHFRFTPANLGGSPQRNVWLKPSFLCIEVKGGSNVGDGEASVTK
jgi:hypothetical protein